ncbi:OLC1v1017986C1 [Oldenlandia corymbosa var. corymbosa]|uniref:OLC1v1017986C1 n=1 Tax=Oldenlandia corymbosa var. corymbosa TaxID=529605 RepID=A0AAV1EAN6_OLDCO|nr:OLC1v1017986C1 [Oldenlandia corymbosa var. corymbosa]
MSDHQENGQSDDDKVVHSWPEELKLTDLLYTETIQEIHRAIQSDWDSTRRSACQTAAARALWNHVVHDPLAELLAGETSLRTTYEKIKKDCLNNAREISGVILAVRTLWFDSKLEAALNSFAGGAAQIVLLGAGMDTRAYRLSYLKESKVFEVDFPEVMQTKATILQAAAGSTTKDQHPVMTAKSLSRVAADLRDNDWLQELQKVGFEPEQNTVWILEGILYYLSYSDATEVLKIIAESCKLAHTVLLADFMNKQSTALCSSIFRFYCDWPEQLLPTLGFSDVKLSQIGDPDAHFGLLHDPLNLFNRLRSLPRSLQTNPDDGTPCCRLYLVQASRSPTQDIQQ